MRDEEILGYIDYTLLLPTAEWEDMVRLSDEGIKYKTASICIPPSFVKRVRDYVQDRIPICTVIGFPNGYSTTETKVYESKNAISNGAQEIDMVININDLKTGLYDKVRQEIEQIKNVCKGKILKVIIETCLLTEEEKIIMCNIINESGADYIKTSTGFSTKGAAIEDILLFKENLSKEVKIKASGGIRSIEKALTFINLGCHRLGTSSLGIFINHL